MSPERNWKCISRLSWISARLAYVTLLLWLMEARIRLETNRSCCVSPIICIFHLMQVLEIFCCKCEQKKSQNKEIIKKNSKHWYHLPMFNGEIWTRTTNIIYKSPSLQHCIFFPSCFQAILVLSLISVISVIYRRPID